MSMKRGHNISETRDIFSDRSEIILDINKVKDKVVALVQFQDQRDIDYFSGDPRIDWMELNQNTRHVNKGELQGKTDSTDQTEYLVSISTGTRLDELNDIEIIDTILVRGKVVALTRADPERLETLKSNAKIDEFEPNLNRYIPTPVQPPEIAKRQSKQARHREKRSVQACEQQYGSTRTIWGLVRTSYHPKPSYNTDPYEYDVTGSDVTIYVVDTGVDITHPEFEGRAIFGMVSNEWADEGPYDLNGHGTNVASLAAGMTYGVAKNASIVACKVLGVNGTGSSFSIIQGLVWVINRVDSQRQAGKAVRAVINMSLGGPGRSPIEEKIIQSAIDLNIPVVVAAGNDGIDASQSSPGSYNTTVTVAATGPRDSFASFSNYGPDVDISAAGVGCLGAYSTNVSSCDDIPASQCLVYMSGTSQATPHVSGVVALWLESLEDNEIASVTPNLVKTMLGSTASLNYITFSRNLPAAVATFNGILYHGAGECQIPGTNVNTTTSASTTTSSTTSTTTSSTTSSTFTASSSTVYTKLNENGTSSNVRSGIMTIIVSVLLLHQGLYET